MNWIVQLDPRLLGLLVVGAYLGLGMGGYYALRGYLRRALGGEHGVHNGSVAAFISPAGTLCGLLLGLVAVTAWRSHSEAASLVSHEATTLAALYRDVSDYPQPVRDELRGLVKEYVRYVIDEAWPVQRRCEVPQGGVPRAYALFKRLASFTPANARESIEHQEAMRAFNIFFEARRARLDAVTRGLPETLWWVVVATGIIVIGMTWCIVAPLPRVQAALTAALSVVVGLLVFLIVALDKPFCGPMGVDPAPFVLIRDQLMRD